MVPGADWTSYWTCRGASGWQSQGEPPGQTLWPGEEIVSNWCRKFNLKYIEQNYVLIFSDGSEVIEVFLLLLNGITNTKLWLWNKKMVSDFQLWTSPAKPAKQKNTRYWTFLWVTPPPPPAEVQPRAVIFLSKFLTLSTGLLWRRSLPKIAAIWRYRLSINNLTAHYNNLRREGAIAD